MDVQVVGAEKAAGQIDRMSLSIKGASLMMIRRLAFHAFNVAKGYCPVDTGLLRSSINVKEEPNKGQASIGTPVHYAPYVEFGTRNSPAQPFLQPALQEAKVLASEIALEEVGRAVKQ